ncbi:MAG: hypothetical protein ACQESN_11395 [Thermotogota bacterium]
MSKPKYTEVPKEYKGEVAWWLDLNRVLKEHGDVFEAAKAHPIYHLAFLIGMKPRDYQIYGLDMMFKNKYLYYMWSRRLGKSTIFKAFSNWAISWNKYPQGLENTTKVLVMAHTQDAADDYITVNRTMFEMGDKRVEALTKGKMKRFFTKNFATKRDNAKLNGSELSMRRIYNPLKPLPLNRDRGWNTIKTFPPTNRARGEPASIVQLDEIAAWKNFVPDDDEIYYDVVRPIPTDFPEAKIFCATTPKGEKGLGYNLLPLDGHKTIYELIWFPYWVRDEEEYIKSIKEIEEEYEAQGKSKKFRQEYLSELIDVSDSFFPDELVNLIFSKKDKLGLYTDYKEECHLGLDFGGSRNSHTVITISRKNPETGHLERIYHKKYPIAEDMTLKDDLLELSNKFNIVLYHIDNQGGGTSFYAWIRNKFGRNRLDEVSFKRDKQMMYRLFKIAMYQKRIYSYYDKELYKEFKGFTNDLRPEKGFTDDMLDSFVMSIRTWLPLEKHNNTYKSFNKINNFKRVMNHGKKRNFLVIH